MKRILPMLIPLLGMAVSLLAQPTNYYNRMNHIFGAIDKSKVSTGLLKEFGIRLNEVEAYSGVISSTNWVDNTQWQSLYHSLYSMRVGTNITMAAPKSVYSHLDNQQAAAGDVILLAAQYYDYNQYKANAYTNGDVTVSNNRIYDVAGRNPYDTKRAFAVAPMEYHLKGNSFAFKLQSNMIYTNTSKTLSSVQVDFGNGQGYQTLTLNSTKNVSYSSSGEKELKVKFVYNGGPTLYSHAKLYVEYISPTVANTRFDGFGVTVTPITGTPYLGASATGDVTVELAAGHSQLTKPLIVVEGFDPFDSFDYIDLIDGENIGGIEVEINQSTNLTLNQAIEDEGYDLVFVNYRNGTDYIQRNAFMVEAVIEWVNNQKVGNEKNAVLGMSMGGLVARYALRHMETTGRTHETGLYISHDAPHQGANVPLGYQAFVRHLVGESIGWPLLISSFTINIVDIEDLAPDLKQGLDLLQTPAAQQMLIYQLQGTGNGTSIDNSTLHSSFSTEYESLGYPVQGGIKNIAISNGSECGSPLDFAPNATLVNIDETIDLPFFSTNILFTVLNVWSINPIRSVTSFLSTNTDIKAKFSVNALPDRQSQRIYRGRIYTKKKVLGFINVEEPLINEKSLNSSSSMLPLDNAGGGVYDINLLVSLPPEIAQYILEPRFNFIPTYSSLDIGGGSQTITTTELNRVYSPLVPPTGSKSTPFDNFFTNPLTSQNHIQFTLNNGNWLLDELQGSTGFYSCVGSCATQPGIVINGAPTVCSSNSTFTISNPPLAGNISWSRSSNLTYVSGQGTNQYTVRAISSSTQGTAWVRATIDTNCGNVSKTKNFWVGKPELDGYISGNSTVNCSHIHIYDYNGTQGGATSSHWVVGEQFDNISVIDNTELFVEPTNEGNGYVTYVTSNACGEDFLCKPVSVLGTSCGPAYINFPTQYSCGDGSPFSVSSSASGNFVVYPNPVSNDEAHVLSAHQHVLSVETSTGTISREPPEPIHLDIYRARDQHVVYSRDFASDQFQITTSALEKGTYYFVITQGATREVKRVIIE